MMNSDHVELLVIEHQAFSLYIRGKPYNRRFSNLKQYKQKSQLDQQAMNLRIQGVDQEQAFVFNPIQEELVPISTGSHPPIFFENEVYQLVVTPKDGCQLNFYHEHPQVRNAVNSVGPTDRSILMGQLQFINEIGFTTFEIQNEYGTLVEVTIELFPTKLDYKEDYQRLLHEVSEEIYNLVFHFMNKTFIGTSKIHSKNPSPVEFYQLLQHYFSQFLHSVHNIEKQPHHELVTHYRKVRGDKLKKADRVTRNYLRKRPYLFQEVPNGIPVNNATIMPEKGINKVKEISYNTRENQFVKFMIKRLEDKVADLRRAVEQYERNHPTNELNIAPKLKKQQQTLKTLLHNNFWKQIDQLNHSIISLVMHLKPGYRDAYTIFLVLAQGLNLNEQIIKMSVKDVASLYENWTFLKIGQFLHKNYIPDSQDIIKVQHNGLFVNLDQSKKALRTFIHPWTSEKITLSFQERYVSPTVVQKPDIMLTIEKKDHSYTYNYIFDAKYRINYGDGKSTNVPGPLEEDINTMHRYRDAWVFENNGPYERHAFGAYVLFPWSDETNYEEEHPLYQSINQVNIGGIPFLPNSTRLVEQFVEHLIESSPEALQQDGILPKGAVEYWNSSLRQQVLVGLVQEDKIQTFLNERYFKIPLNYLHHGWQKAEYLALYIPKLAATNANMENGITHYGKITTIDFNMDPFNNLEYVVFYVERWKSLPKAIRPVGYGIQHYTLTTINKLKFAKELPELFIQTKEELQIWRMLRRIHFRIHVDLDSCELDQASSVERFTLGDKHAEILINQASGNMLVISSDRRLTLPLLWLKTKPTKVFQEICRIVFKDD